jgi:succinate-acetate transporter protein
MCVGPEQSVILNKWFKNLDMSDKLVAMTIVDKDLVQLFKSMYKMDGGQGYSGGIFTAYVC